MIQRWLVALMGLIMGLATGALHAQEAFVYPNKGQSAEQQEKDKFECYGWAKKNSGFDPMAPPTTSTPAPSGQKKSGGAVRGGLGGAALGAILGNSDDAKKGAAAGALIGGVRQSRANRATEQRQQEWAQREANQYASSRSAYNRAYSACLEGRGYTVK